MTLINPNRKIMWGLCLFPTPENTSKCVKMGARIMGTNKPSLFASKARALKDVADLMVSLPQKGYTWGVKKFRPQKIANSW